LEIFPNVDDGSIATYADALNNLLTPLGKCTSNRTEFGLSTNSRTALPEADENTVAAYLEQRTSSANRIAEQVDANNPIQPETAPSARHSNSAIEGSAPAVNLQERVIDAEDGPEQADESAHDHTEATPVEVDPDTTTQGTGSTKPYHTTNNDSTTPTSSRKSRTPKEQGTWTSDHGGYHFITISPTIIKLKDGSFVELRCDTCNGNSSWAHQTMNKGIRGFQSHFRQIHDDKSGVETTLQRCTYRVVSADEVEQIITGATKIDLVACKTKVSVGSGVEYVGQAETGSIPVSRGGHTVESLAAAAMPAARSIGRSPMPSTLKALKGSGRTRDFSLPSLANCLVVVKASYKDGSEEYHELRCDVCHGNGSFGSGKLLEGIKGFKAHYRQIHDEKLLTIEILQRCSYREVSLQEVQQIQSGNVGIGFIKCEGSAKVRPKKSYQNFNNAQRS
jgi:hypothetical protein